MEDAAAELRATSTEAREARDRAINALADLSAYGALPTAYAVDGATRSKAVAGLRALAASLDLAEADVRRQS